MASNKKVDLKVVMLGRQAVGKSALVERFSNDRFTPATASTIGGSFCAKEVHLNAWTTPDGKQHPARTVTLGVWDTAGSERYESLTRHYFTNAECAFVCFDLTDSASWAKVDHWIAELQKIEPNCRIYIIGTKSDLIAGQGAAGGARPRGATHAAGAAATGGQRNRAIAAEEVETYCHLVQPEAARYFETSAQQGLGVQAAFEAACRDWASRARDPDADYAARARGAIHLDEPERNRNNKGLAATCCNQ